MPWDGCMSSAAHDRARKEPVVGRPKRDRSKNKAQRRARKGGR